MALSFNAERALHWLSLEENASSQHIPSDILSRREQRRAYLELRQQGLLYDGEDTDGNFNFLLNSNGELAGHQIQDVYRNSLAQVQILDWLNSTNQNDSIQRILETDFIEDFSGKLTLEEIQQAAHELQNEGIIKSTKAFGGDMIHPELTEKGRKLHMKKMSLNQEATIEASYTTNFNTTTNGNVSNINSGGNHVNMEAHTTINNSGLGAEDLSRLLSELKEVVDRSSIDDAYARELKEELNDIGDRAPKRSFQWLRSAISTFINEVTRSVGTETGDAMVDSIRSYIQLT